MRIGVLGGTHLGQVTAACLASIGHDVMTYGKPTAVDEPGLSELQISERLKSASKGWEGDAWGTAAQIEEAGVAKNCTTLWCCQDMPVDSDDVSFVPAVVEEIKRVVGHMPPESLVIVSSQIPVGTTRKLSEWRPDLLWAYSPENLRRKHAIYDFLHPTRIVVGTPEADRLKDIIELLQWAPIFWTDFETAECIKHSLNALLGATIALTNEIAELAVLNGANPKQIETALRSEPRIGIGLPIRAGEGFTGGTLGRDLRTLEKLGTEAGLPMTLVRAILESNARRLSL